MDEERIDKWLWNVRLFKTRRAAADACQAGKVKLNNHSIKPGRTIKYGDELQITRKLYRQQVKVTGFSEHRVSAAIAATLYEDLTPEDEIERLQLERTMESVFYKDRHGAGRPTKRNRRALQKFKDKF